MSPIELTEEQRRRIEAEPGRPVEVVNPATNRVYVLLAREQYEKVRSLLVSPPVPPPQEGAAAGQIPPGILRSQQAFWRDLPRLLSQKKLCGQWVCYHGDERVGIATYEELIRECLRRGLRDDEYDLHVIEPRARPPWEPVEIEAGGHEVGDDVETDGQSGDGYEPA